MPDFVKLFDDFGGIDSVNESRHREEASVSDHSNDVYYIVDLLERIAVDQYQVAEGTRRYAPQDRVDSERCCRVYARCAQGLFLAEAGGNQGS